MSESPSTDLEFDCCECGGHIVMFVGPLPEPRLCSLCLMLPGWVDDPKLREIFAHHLPESTKPAP